ncbi:uncharacterized protein SCODWIG_01450 [Saccharomycodes ludwigii]|uniref:t-SNARE coiled-coil homology domain-containing protein n=1 Tax=Saccharomycodes ludwigii TaxID=36035 RepID=A0A376B528_9ASCO|nr:hypothetical protein SCDLUD_000492 [Saccharomycodes ludwigii]KAH3902897.1 hypothetical protein SCDLUD_000492 [Saccharomycodes ludwigii]SSD59689.1 uncharacterized protein SCODWIG_01450 [Saccharomycodes ludwigii]
MEVAKLKYELDKLQDIIEERNRLITILNLKPSRKDTISLKKQLNIILNIFDELDLYNNGDYNMATISELHSIYTNLLDIIPDNDNDISKSLYEYKLKHKLSNVINDTDNKDNDTTSSISSLTDAIKVKKVRFNEHDEIHKYNTNSNSGSNAENENINRLNFAPYSDIPDENNVNYTNNPAHHTTEGSFSMLSTNREIFSDQKQQLQQQDGILDSLHSTIKRTHQITLGINHEVELQNNEIIPDLERMVDSTDRNLKNANVKLNFFNKFNSTKGSFSRGFIIFLLFIVLLIVIAI